MTWFFAFLIIAALAAVVGAAVLGARPSFPARTAAIVLAVALLAVVAALLWRQTLLALAIASCLSLAVGVMFTKVAPAKAFAAAFAALVLMFLGPWLALQMAGPLLFGRQSDLTRWFSTPSGRGWPAGGEPLQHPGIFVAIAVAGLLAACFLGRRMKALAVFVAALLLLLFGPRLLEDHGIILSDLINPYDPAMRLLVVALIAFGIAGLVRLLSNSGRKNP